MAAGAGPGPLAVRARLGDLFLIGTTSTAYTEPGGTGLSPFTKGVIAGGLHANSHAVSWLVDYCG
jgi:hypothetical protein